MYVRNTLYYKDLAESQGHFAPTKNLGIKLKIERNLQGGSTFVPLKIFFYYVPLKILNRIPTDSESEELKHLDSILRKLIAF